jgi:hypothetical protein
LLAVEGRRQQAAEKALAGVQTKVALTNAAASVWRPRQAAAA